MAHEQQWGSISGVAGEDLSAKQYYACKMNSSGAAVLAGAGESATFGICLGAPQSGEVSSFGMLGVFPAKLGGEVVAGAVLTPNASGALVTATADDAVIGVAREAGVSGNIINILMIPQLETNSE